MRLSPELSLKHKFTLNHVQLMKLLSRLTIKLNVLFNAVNLVTSLADLQLSGLYTVHHPTECTHEVNHIGNLDYVL